MQRLTGISLPDLRQVSAATLAALLAAMPGTGRASEPSESARCEALGERAADEDAMTGNVVVFGLADDKVAAYFQRHRLVVAEVRQPPVETEDGWRISVIYPSYNSGGEAGGSTVGYPQEVALVWDESQAEALAELDLRRLLLVFHAENGTAMPHRWIGCALPRAGADLDWFAGQPELLFRPVASGDG